MRQTCWDKSASTNPVANVSVSFTVIGDGSTSRVSASGDNPDVIKCVANDVRSWRFPAMGCTQTINVPFHFVRQ
jgi:hypothetical protein